MEAGTELTCPRHGVPTRITCVECGTPICPDCAIRTPVGLKCPDHATAPATPRGSRMTVVIVVVVLAAFLGVAQLARSTGRGEPAKPRCPTETAPDVGIGPQSGSGHWRELAVAPVCGRYDAAIAWTGEDLLVWGGESCAGADCPSDSAPHLADGAAYRPATDTWRKLAASPLTAREPAATAWTGTELLVWGGTTGTAPVADGAAYDPGHDRWRALAPSPLSPRTGSAAAWTGREMIVWGGGDQADGAAYDPATNRWRPLAASPLAGRSLAVSAWTGRELLVWGGVTLDGTNAFSDGAAYDPATDRWRSLATGPLDGRYAPAGVWTDKELVVWGGNAPGQGAFADGAAYDPAADRWRSLPPAPVAPRTAPATVWSGKEVLVWGGLGRPGSGGGSGSPLDQVLEPRTDVSPLGDGAAYDPAADRWRPLEPVSLLGRGFPAAVWDGHEMVVWGGLVAVSSPASAADGVRYTP